MDLKDFNVTPINNIGTISHLPNNSKMAIIETKKRIYENNHPEIYLESISLTLQSTDFYLKKSLFEEMEYDKKPDLIEEGLIDGIWKVLKNIVTGLIKFLIKLWNGLVSIIKAIFSKIKGFFTGNDSSIHTEKPKTMKVITIESAEVQQNDVSSKSEAKTVALKAIDSIAREISERSEIQIECTKELRKFIEDPIDKINEAKILYGKTIKHRNLGGTYSNYSIEGNDIINTIQRSDIRKHNSKNIKRVLESDPEDIVSEYKYYLYDFFMTSARQAGVGNGSETTMEELLATQYFDLATSDEFKGRTYELMKFFTEQYFHISSNPETIKKILTLRENYNRKIVNLLSDMARINYKAAGYTAQEIELEIKRIKEGRFDAIDNAYDEVIKHFDECKIRPGWISFKKFNGGDVFYQYDDPQGVTNSIEKNPIPFYTLSLQWDCIIEVHGGDSREYPNLGDAAIRQDFPKETEELHKLNEELDDLIFNFEENSPYDIKFEELEDEFDTLKTAKKRCERKFNKNKISREDYESEMNKIIYQQKELQKQMDLLRPKTSRAKREKREQELRVKIWEEEEKLKKIVSKYRTWSCEPVQIGNHPISRSIPNAVRNAIKDGYKRIFITACNGGHLELPEDIKKAKGVIIHMGKEIGLANNTKSSFGSYQSNSFAQKFSQLKSERSQELMQQNFYEMND